MRVLVTQRIADAGIRILEQAGLDVDAFEDEAPIPRPHLLERVRHAHALIPMPTDRVDAALLDAAPHLRVVACHSVGTDHVDLDGCSARGVRVTNTPGVLTDATADLTMALLLAVARHVVRGDRLAREGRFRGWRPTMLRGLELRGATLGIVGMGRIGRAVAERARAFGMEVVGRSSTSGPSLHELLGMSDVVSLHCPLTPRTHHLIDAEALAHMRPTALLINTARGPVVDEDALCQALRDGRLAGAGLDVHAEEPRVHEGLRALDQVVLLPHLGSATWTAREAMATKAARSAVAVLTGTPVPDLVV